MGPVLGGAVDKLEEDASPVEDEVGLAVDLAFCLKEECWSLVQVAGPVVEWDATSAQSQCELNTHKKSHVHSSNARVEDNECVHTHVYKRLIYK